MPIKVKAYKCQWCNRVSRTKSGIIQHEKRCHSNPEFKCCENCVHAFIKRMEAKDDVFGIMYAEAPYCAYHDTEIFAPSGHNEYAYFIDCELEDYGDSHERPIPYTCWWFKSKGSHGFVSEQEWQQEYQDESDGLRGESNG